MKSISAETVRQLRIREAIEMEANTVRNLVPKDFDWNQILDKRDSIERWIRTQLRIGFNPGAQEVVSVRKLQGTRPVPIWGPVERIVYRALAVLALGKDFNLDRSAKAYLEFVTAPLKYGSKTSHVDQKSPFASLFWSFDSDIKYVVKSDIAAFYQYVDHAVLSRELLTCGADVEPVQALVDLLEDVQGRSYGIPQLLDSSDMLSEVYIDRLERDLLRRGLAVWRYNDDFRIACKKYEDALLAIELLDSAARDIGLVISESKTLIYKFSTYVEEVEAWEVKPEQEGQTTEDVEVAVGDYTDDFSQDVDAALSLISRTANGDDAGSINLNQLSYADLRLLRRAFGSMAQAGDPRALEFVRPFAIYAPALFPSIMRYVRAAHDAESDAVVKVVDSVVASASMNEWQHQWMVQSMYEMSLLNDSSPGKLDERREWVSGIRRDSPSNVSTAYATRALATAGVISIDNLILSYEKSNSVLVPLYLDAIGELFRNTSNEALRKRVRSISKTSPVHAALIGDIDENSTSSHN